MGEIIFEGHPPFEPMSARRPTANATRDGVELVLNVLVGEAPHDTVPVRILLEPEDADGLADLLKVHAGTVDRWRRSGVT
jgi:hypothetical protein